MKRRSIVLASACLVGLFLPVVTRLLDGNGHAAAWLIDLASHWQWVFLAGLVLFGTVAVWGRRPWVALFLAAPLPWLTASAQAPVTVPGKPQLKVAAANVGLATRDPGPLLGWLEAQNVDLAALSEVTPAFADALRTRSRFQFSHLEPRHGPFGLALLSKQPLVEPTVSQDRDGIPHIRATVLWQDRPVTVTAVHPMPPLSAHYHETRNQRLRDAALEAASTAQPGILLGDLNASPWSSAMLGPAAAGFHRATGLAPTWPAALRGVLGIPIDQVLVSRHWSVAESGTGPVMASDHLPVWASISLLPHGIPD